MTEIILILCTAFIINADHQRDYCLEDAKLKIPSQYFEYKSWEQRAIKEKVDAFKERQRLLVGIKDMDKEDREWFLNAGLNASDFLPPNYDKK